MIFDASQELTLKNPAYKKAVKHVVWGAYAEDAGKGDATTRFFVDHPRRVVSATVVAKEAGILAGMQEARWLLGKLGISVRNALADGTKLRKGQVIMQLTGRTDRLLASERTFLNLLQRMSGIATATRKLVTAAPKGVSVLATRKTFWGLLDKRAAVLGGGVTHRLNLADAILVKENHIALSDDYEKSLRRVFKKAGKARFVEVETETPAEAKRLLAVYKKYEKSLRLTGKVAMMLDDFTPVQIRKMAPELKAAGLWVEVSGGIHAGNVRRFALPGVDAVSSGSITNKAPALDLSMLIAHD